MNNNDTFVKCTIEITPQQQLTKIIFDIENTFITHYDNCGENFYSFHIADYQLESLIEYCEHRNFTMKIEK